MASFFRTNIDNFVNTIRFINHYCRGNSYPQPWPQSSSSSRRPNQQPRQRPIPTYFGARSTGENSSTRGTSSNNNNSNNNTTNTSREACFEEPHCQNPHHNHSRSRRTQQNPTRTHNQSTNQEQSNMSTNPGSRNPPPVIKSNYKLDIGDIGDVSDISRLSVRELKTILTRNCIDYKGCCEKDELRAKVTDLWLDFNRRREARRHNRARQNQDPTANGAQDSSDEIEENQLCKICMEREIDCVLLECGHYLTCVTCGRKLPECPICRQNITRCVRTFKG